MRFAFVLSLLLVAYFAHAQDQTSGGFRPRATAPPPTQAELSAAAIIGIIVGVLVVVFTIIFAVVRFVLGCRRGVSDVEANRRFNQALTLL